MPRAGLGPRRWQPLAWPAEPSEASTPDAASILVFLGFSSAAESVALALPQEQVAFAAWHLFLEGGCQEGANLGIALCVLRVLARVLAAPWRSSPGPAQVEEVTEGLVSHPRAPSSPSRRLTGEPGSASLRSVCWGLVGG